jgi:hypothetical protein
VTGRGRPAAGGRARAPALSTRSRSTSRFPEQDQRTVVSTSSVWITCQACGVHLVSDVRLGRAVPGAEARRSSTSPSPPGAQATIRWSRSPAQGDHRIVALAGAGRARRWVREARRASPSAPTGAVVFLPGHGGPEARGARAAHASSGGHAPQEGGREWCISTERREARSRVAPTPPTRGHDPICRLSMAVPTTMSTRYFGSCPRRSRVSVVHGCHRSHGQPIQRIMRAATAETGPPHA